MATAGIDTIYDFSSVIEPRVRLTKKGDKIVYETVDSQNLVYAKLEMPASELPFDGDEIGFLDYPDFYNNVKLIDNAAVKVVKDEAKKEEYIEIKGKNAKSKYHLSDCCVIPRVGEDVIPPRDNVGYTFNLSKDEINDIIKIFTTTKTKDLELAVTTAGLKLTFKGEGLYTEFVKVKAHTEPFTGEEFTCESNLTIFNKLPKRNYTVKLDRGNLIEFNLIPNENEKDISVLVVA